MMTWIRKVGGPTISKKRVFFYSKRVGGTGDRGWVIIGPTPSVPLLSVLPLVGSKLPPSLSYRQQAGSRAPVWYGEGRGGRGKVRLSAKMFL